MTTLLEIFQKNQTGVFVPNWYKTFKDYHKSFILKKFNHDLSNFRWEESKSKFVHKYDPKLHYEYPFLNGWYAQPTYLSRTGSEIYFFQSFEDLLSNLGDVLDFNKVLAYHGGALIFENGIPVGVKNPVTLNKVVGFETNYTRALGGEEVFFE